MQGDIWIISNPEGCDKSMALVLRFQKPSSIVIGMSEHGASDRSYSNSLLRGLKVLLADDDDINRAVTRKLLEKLGCVVSAVGSGYDCLSAVRTVVSSFRIVILDLHMPDLDGFEVTSRIRKFRSRSWPLIIALTSSDDDEIWSRCHQVGMSGVIRKPVQMQGIEDELQRVLMQANRGV